MSAWIKGTTRGDSQAWQGNLNLPFFYRPKNDTPSPLLPLFLLHQCPLDAILPNSFWQNKRKRSQQLTSSPTWSRLKQCTFRNSKINYFNFSFPSLNSCVMTKNISTVAILQCPSRLPILAHWAPEGLCAEWNILNMFTLNILFYCKLLLQPIIRSIFATKSLKTSKVSIKKCWDPRGLLWRSAWQKQPETKGREDSLPWHSGKARSGEKLPANLHSSLLQVVCLPI